MRKEIIVITLAILSAVWFGGCVSAQRDTTHVTSVTCKPRFLTETTRLGPRTLLILNYQDGKPGRFSWYDSAVDNSQYVQLDTNTVYHFELLSTNGWYYGSVGVDMDPRSGFSSFIHTIKKSGSIVWKDGVYTVDVIK